MGSPYVVRLVELYYVGLEQEPIHLYFLYLSFYPGIVSNIRVLCDPSGKCRTLEVVTEWGWRGDGGGTLGSVVILLSITYIKKFFNCSLLFV